MSQRVAVVTGSNKGIGFSIVKGLLQRFDGAVFLTARDDGRGRAAVNKLNELGLKPEYHQLDVTDRNSVLAFRNYVKNKYGGIDILINNAAIVDHGDGSYEESKRVVEIDYYSILTMQELVFPIVKDGGRILNISSDCGHLSNIRNKSWIERLSKKDITVDDIDEFVQWYLNSVKNGTFNPDDFADSGTIASYRVAKVALSAATMVQQRELAARGVCVNSMHPGLVQTEMTNHAGFYTTEQAADTPLYLVLDAPHTLQGAYVWFDRKVFDWYDYKADYYFKYKTLDD